MHSFLLSLGIIFVAELGDKSQLMAMTFTARYRATTILLAITSATALVHLFSVLLGAVVGAALPTEAISVDAGIAFLGERGRYFVVGLPGPDLRWPAGPFNPQQRRILSRG